MATGLVTMQPLAAEAQAAGETFVVNSVRDDRDANTADGVCRTSGGVCTLRAAVEQANYNQGPNTIQFNIAGGGFHTINLGPALVINDRSGGTTIDGYSQPGASPNTAEDGSNANIRIGLVGSSLNYSMMRIESAANNIRGLAMRNGLNRIEVVGEEADGNRIQGNFIGFFPNFTKSVNTVAVTYGVLIHLGPDRNLIGGPNRADRNIISGNDFVAASGGIRINHGETSQNIVENNVIGLGPNFETGLYQGIGVDIQYWTWGNHVENNIISGHHEFGVDLSHSAVENTIINNNIGTLADGNTTIVDGSNRWSALAIKDDAKKNYIADNVMMGGDPPGQGGTFYGIFGRHDFNGPNTIVNNRIGVGRNGAANSRFTAAAIMVNGHDDLIQDNIIATDNSKPPLTVIRHYGGNAAFPSELTERNRIQQNTFRYGTTNTPLIDLSRRSVADWPQSVDDGYTANDNGDGDSGPNTLLNTPVVSSYGPGAITGWACGNCTVEVYQSGAVRADGSIDPGSTAAGTGAAYLGRVTADGSGRWGLADSRIRAGKQVFTLAIDAVGNTSETTRPITIGSSRTGSPTTTPVASSPRRAIPPAPPRPPAYQTDFACSHDRGVLTWDDAGVNEYYVWSVNAQGVENYLGPQTGTSLNVPAADSYRVEHWGKGFATNATCRGDGDGGNPNFACSVTDGVLTWTDVGAPEYYVFATTGGTEGYLGGHKTTSLNVRRADSYRVEHWMTGQATNATCDGPGGGGNETFSCSVTDGVLTWTDAGASDYYVFATTDGVERYLGGHKTTSLAVAPADSYRVEHWMTGQATNATCEGPGGNNETFSCSVTGGVLSWTDVGAPDYYVFATTGGTERYLGGHKTTSLAVDPADSYRVEHWITGQATNAICP